MKTKTSSSPSALSVPRLSPVPAAVQYGHGLERTRRGRHSCQHTVTPIQIRALAIVNAAIYDAVNGITRTYEPYFVD